MGAFQHQSGSARPWISTASDEPAGSVRLAIAASLGAVCLALATAFPVAGDEVVLRVSTADSRTLDLFLLRPGQTGAEDQASSLLWGHIPGQLGYFDGKYRELAPIDTGWHRYEIIHDLAANTFAVKIDGKLVGEGLGWRNRFASGTAFGRLRISSIRGEAGQYADLANLRITAQPSPPSITVTQPAHPGGLLDPDGVLRFSVTSDRPIEAAAIRARWNGEDVTRRLVIEGEPCQRQASLTGFAPNQSYRIAITAPSPFVAQAASLCPMKKGRAPQAIVDALKRRYRALWKEPLFHQATASLCPTAKPPTTPISLQEPANPKDRRITSANHQPGPGGEPRYQTIACWDGRQWRFHEIARHPALRQGLVVHRSGRRLAGHRAIRAIRAGAATLGHGRRGGDPDKPRSISLAPCSHAHLV